MSLRGMLLGLVALPLAASVANAADTVVSGDPEPVEYVRVCDTYGAGFFYIPGSETCLRLDGYARYRINASEDSDGWYKATRARLNVSTRSETDWGTLAGFIRFQGTWGEPTDGALSIDQAVLQLGGFYAGYTESAFAAPYGLPAPARFGILHVDGGGSYAVQQRHQLGYTFRAGNGFFGSISLEDDALAGDGYMPDAVGTAGLGGEWGAVWTGIGYDESVSEVGIRAGLQLDVPKYPGSSFRAGGFYASDPNAYAIKMPIAGLAEWSVAASYAHQFTEKTSTELGVQYMSGFADDNGYQVAAAVVWVPVENFEVRLQGAYYKQDNLPVLVDDETWNGFISFTRSF